MVKANHSISSGVMNDAHSVQWLYYEMLTYRQWKEKWWNDQTKCPELKLSKAYSLNVFNWHWYRWKLDVLGSGNNCSIRPHFQFFITCKTLITWTQNSPHLLYIFVRLGVFRQNSWSEIWASVLSCPGSPPPPNTYAHRPLRRKVNWSLWSVNWILAKTSLSFPRTEKKYIHVSLMKFWKFEAF